MRMRLAISVVLSLAFCGARSQSEQKMPADNHAEGSAAALLLQYDRPSGIRCRDLQLLSSSGQPLAGKRISVTREYVKADPQHPSKMNVRLVEAARDLFTNKYGHLPLPALEPGTYVIQMQGAEKPASGDVEVYRWTPRQTCSQAFVAEDKGKLPEAPRITMSVLSRLIDC